MELVYLWVDSYKNIEKQGFNFSPRFECSYDETSEKLTIDENKNYVSIFPENINVTAIVGENGSGKSNLLDLIMELDNWGKISDSFFFITSDEKIYTVNFNKNINSNLKIKTINRQNSKQVSSTKLSKMAFLTLSPFINELDRLYSSGVDVMSIFDKDNYENNNFIFDHFYLYLIPKIPTILDNQFTRDFFKIEGKPNYLIFKINKLVKDIFKEEVTKIFNEALQKDETPNSYLYQADIKNNNLLNNIFDLFKKIENKKEENNKSIRDIDQTTIANRIPNMKGKKVFDKVNTLNDIKQNRLKREKEALKTEIDNIGRMKFYFAKDKESHNSFYFSTGELVILYYIEKLQQLNSKENDLILLLDECELFLHPEWQKKLMLYLINLFNTSKFKRQIILTSHSPFLLSDLPKENVIFLEKGSQVDVNINPFGANIHTLLSHGFFMKDGLMGEFAKTKINEVIKYLKNEDSEIKTDEEAQSIINIIGEPVLRSTLQDMLDKKLYSNESKIDKLRRQQKEIEEAIKLEEHKDESNDKS